MNKKYFLQQINKLQEMINTQKINIEDIQKWIDETLKYNHKKTLNDFDKQHYIELKLFEVKNEN